MSDHPANAECSTCENSFEWHQKNNPRHPFNAGDMSTSTTFGARRSDGVRTRGSGAQRGSEPAQQVDPIASAPFDPVLRQALIDKGVLTPDDLRRAEETIRAVTAAFHKERSNEGSVSEA